MTNEAVPAVDDSLLRVERGDPTDEELAALVTVVIGRLAASGTGSSPPPGRRSEWSNAARAVRDVHRPGPGGWRASAFPR
ncbi:MAG TPA: acyl-CoA carboxylase subunit epsilon [Nocardioidaceae bacterium]|nr:acyl-CoA carboxylase subunit epsilon [Nocardioidaceae bacterium]